MSNQTKEKIIITTQQIMLETASINVRLTDIAERVGITHGALYRHFPDKQSIMVAVAKRWFEQAILQNIHVASTVINPLNFLHDWLWQFANAKKAAYRDSPQMFELNTLYVENDPAILREVLLSSMKMIDDLMNFHDATYLRAEIILAAFSEFTLPSFRKSWYSPDYTVRFERLWQLISMGLTNL